MKIMSATARMPMTNKMSTMRHKARYGLKLKSNQIISIRHRTLLKKLRSEGQAEFYE